MKLKRNDKIIIGFYIFLLISFMSTLFYISMSFQDLPTPNWVLKPIKEIEFEKLLEIKKEQLFLTMTDVQNYPRILPNTFVSVNILEITTNQIIAEEEIQEKGVRIKLLVKHSTIPHQEHKIEILDGDAKGTIIQQQFIQEGNFTKLITKVNVNFNGLLTPFRYIPESNVQHAMNSVTTSFYEYSKGYDSPEKNLIDNLYREILLRPADKDGLEYYAKLLENGQKSLDEIRTELSTSNEAKYLVKSSELKKINELNENSINSIDNLYREILLRPADKDGLEYYGTLFESGKLSLDDIETHIFNSQEALSLRLSLPTMKLIDDFYFEINGKHADLDTLNHYRALLETKKITIEEIKNHMLVNNKQ